jgi:hypothetical protein
MRLEAVHDTLLCARPQDTTVTRVAAEVGGFFHLGRFAGEYLAGTARIASSEMATPPSSSENGASL